MRVTAGRVYLVGAGPGAPDLLTLRAVRVLAAADVVLVDDLVDRNVLSCCKPEAKIIAVGKRAGCRSTPQDFIQRLMLRYARAGLSVVRLKGGDPFVFGRGGEELEFLARHGVQVEVVPGLTAGIAVPAALGVPVTHRDLTHGVTLVTGHTRADGAPDWKALAHTGTTLVIYMGLRRIEPIARQLIGHGVRATTPAAVIEQGTHANQRHVLAPLSEIAHAAHAARLKAPALIVIGDVVGHAQVQAVSSARAAMPAAV
jgi:uroporphyrin-III C-methyltransferase